MGNQRESQRQKQTKEEGKIERRAETLELMGAGKRGNGRGEGEIISNRADVLIDTDPCAGSAEGILQ